MNLSDIRNGSRVLLDSNILLYAAARHSRECVALIERIANGVVEACLTTVTVGEVCHRWMMEECRDRGIVLGGNPAKALAEKRHVISQLSNNNPSRTESAMIERCPPLIVASQWGFPR